MVIATTPALVALCSTLPVLLVAVRMATEDMPADAMILEIIGSVVTVLAAYCLQAILQYRTRRKLRYKKMASDLDAASYLLHLTCDAVVELDADLRMTEHTPALAAMLLRGRPGWRVCGKRHVCMFPLEGFFFRVGRVRQIAYNPQ